MPRPRKPRQLPPMPDGQDMYHDLRAPILAPLVDALDAIGIQSVKMDLTSLIWDGGRRKWVSTTPPSCSASA